MVRMRSGLVFVLAASLLLTASSVRADVKSSERTQLKFEGALGSMMGLFGGKAAKEGIVTSTAVKGDRMIKTTDDSATIIDLAEEKVYEVNLKDKSYKVMTFAEMRKRLEEARAKAESSARKQEAREKKDANQREMDIDFSIKESGQKRQINGYNCREIVMTIAIHEKGKTLDQSGGMLMTANSWMAPRIAAMREIEDFNVRYAKKLGEGILPNAEQMAQAMAMYPDLKKAMAKMQAEKVNMDGTPIETIMTVQNVATADQAASKKKDDGKGADNPAAALGGMLGRFGKKKDEPKDAAEAPKKAVADSDTRTTFMTTTTSVLSVATSVAADDVAVPAGFKNKS
jgi:hypothetical protein